MMSGKQEDNFAEDKNNVIHPWVKTTDFGGFHGKPISFVGKVKGADSKTLVLTDFKGKYL